MKIWIISSDPFLKDFEKIATNWIDDAEVVITAISKFGLNKYAFFKFILLYLKIRPNVILTDHGYFGLFIVRFLSLLILKPVKIVFFLRGNYWLETKLLFDKNIGGVQVKNLRPIRKVATLTVTKRSKKEITLIDSSTGIVLTPISKILKRDRKILVFENLWLGDFSLKADDKEIKIDTKKDAVIEAFGVIIEIRHQYKFFEINYLSKGFSKLRLRQEKKLSQFGWNHTIANADVLLVVCKYLKKIVAKETGRKDAVVCPIGIETELPKNTKTLAIKKPAVCIIQNHQIKKKSEALIQFSEVIKKLPEINFYISKGLPENRDNENYKRTIKALEGIKNVNLVNINSKNKFSYLVSSDIYVLATGLDCTPATILEAALAKKPVIASAIGGVPEMIVEGKTGWAIENSDTEKWIEKIKLLVKNKKLSVEMGKNNYEHVFKKYNISKISKEIYKTFI